MVLLRLEIALPLPQLLDGHPGVVPVVRQLSIYVLLQYEHFMACGLGLKLPLHPFKCLRPGVFVLELVESLPHGSCCVLQLPELVQASLLLLDEGELAAQALEVFELLPVGGQDPVRRLVDLLILEIKFLPRVGQGVLDCLSAHLGDMIFICSKLPFKRRLEPALRRWFPSAGGLLRRARCFLGLLWKGRQQQLELRDVALYLLKPFVLPRRRRDLGPCNIISFHYFNKSNKLSVDFKIERNLLN